MSLVINNINEFSRVIGNEMVTTIRSEYKSVFIN